MIANVALDYTEWAPPLYFDRIRADVDVYFMQSCRSPHKIVMWVHQWDFLVKQVADLKPKYVVEKVEVDGTGLKATLRPPESSDGGTIWGIRVEVRDPKAHAA